MDLQLQLATKGNALTYASPENSSLPAWAIWQNQAYGTTFEPVSIAYNKRLLPADAVPGTVDQATDPVVAAGCDSVCRAKAIRFPVFATSKPAIMPPAATGLGLASPKPSL